MAQASQRKGRRSRFKPPSRRWHSECFGWDGVHSPLPECDLFSFPAGKKKAASRKHEAAGR